MKTEFDRIGNRQPMELLSMKRYGIQKFIPKSKIYS